MSGPSPENYVTTPGWSLAARVSEDPCLNSGPSPASTLKQKHEQPAQDATSLNPLVLCCYSKKLLRGNHTFHPLRSWQLGKEDSSRIPLRVASAWAGLELPIDPTLRFKLCEGSFQGKWAWPPESCGKEASTPKCGSHREWLLGHSGTR